MAAAGRLIAAQRDGQPPPWFRSAAWPGCGARSRAGRTRRSGAGAAPLPPVPGIIEPLTARELQVLAMLAGGRSNQAIAAELVVTLDTVKKHVSHVLGKLGAANRTEAVARGRELGLIP